MSFRCEFHNQITNPIIVKAVAAQIEWHSTIPAGGYDVADPVTGTGLNPGERIVAAWDALVPKRLVAFAKVDIDRNLTFTIRPGQVEVS